MGVVGDAADSYADDLAGEIAAVKADGGPDVISWGGGRFAAALVAGELVDE